MDPMQQERENRKPLPQAPSWDEPEKSIVVAVDGSERNRAAIVWAQEEAVAHRRPLTLIHVVDERRVPLPVHALETDDQHAWHLLDATESDLPGVPGLVVRKEVIVGRTSTSLVDRSADQSSLVVGRRGFGRFFRLLIGSTSLNVAGRARVPVVVVPDGWSAHDHASAAVVVGIDRREAQPAVLHYAFTEARTRRVPLVAAHGRDLPDLGDTSAPYAGVQSDREHDDVGEALRQALKPYCDAFPDVSVSVVDSPAHPLTVLLDEAGPTQLLVLGRHRVGKADGFAFGSVAHGILHYAEVPVAVVPPGRPADSTSGGTPTR